MVRGEILSADQQLNETRRDLLVISRNTALKEKGLSDHLQALKVQTQDYENELDAVDDVGNFLDSVQVFLSSAVAQQMDEIHQKRHQVQRKRKRCDMHKCFQ